MQATKSAAKAKARHFIDRIASPYVSSVVAGVRQQNIDDCSVIPSMVQGDHGTSDYFHIANHELRTIELERVPKGARRALSVGAQGRWYFDWFERSVGVVDEHVGVEAYEPRPNDLPSYATWVTDTADHMVGVESASVDLVFAGQTSEHLWANELVGFLTESHRVLRDDGVLALDSPNRIVTEHLVWSHGGHTIELSADEMEGLLELAGFEVLSVAGVWCCVVDGRILQLEEGIENPAVFARRAATARDRPDDCFVWWINARRRDVVPDVEGLHLTVNDLFEAHWNTRVCRGLFPTPGATRLDIPTAATGMLGETLPFPLREGPWTITTTLAKGNWRDVDGFRIRIVAPGPIVIHELPIADASVDGSTATWSFTQPYLLFALSIQLWVDRVAEAAAVALPLDIRFNG